MHMDLRLSTFNLRNDSGRDFLSRVFTELLCIITTAFTCWVCLTLLHIVRCNLLEYSTRFCIFMTLSFDCCLYYILLHIALCRAYIILLHIALWWAYIILLHIFLCWVHIILLHIAFWFSECKSHCYILPFVEHMLHCWHYMMDKPASKPIFCYSVRSHISPKTMKMSNTTCTCVN